MLHIFSPLQRALLDSAAALAPRGLRVANVQRVFDYYKRGQNLWFEYSLFFICTAVHEV